MNREPEAIELFSQAITDLRSPQRDLLLILRTCSHACAVLGWDEHRQRLQRELGGYSPDTEPPWYRKSVYGVLEWRTNDPVLRQLASQGLADLPPAVPFPYEFRHGLSWIKSWAKTGYSWLTGKTATHTRLGGECEIYEVASFNTSAFQGIIDRVEEEVFKFASNAYVTLKYASGIDEVWEAYRRMIEAKLPELGLDGHVQVIERGLRSANPEDWRNVLWKCRDILHDLAANLWRDPRPTYIHLPGEGKGGKLSVTESNHVNRLGAYLHQKLVTGTNLRYLRSEIERMYGQIRALNELASTAHSSVTLSDARTAALGTFFLLGELIRRTDMVPITTYSEQPPSAEPDEGTSQTP